MGTRNHFTWLKPWTWGLKRGILVVLGLLLTIGVAYWWWTGGEKSAHEVATDMADEARNATHKAAGWVKKKTES